MKFKVIFIIFNIVVILAFFFTSLLLPLLMMGPGVVIHLLENYYWVAIIFLVLLGGFNFFFLRNWRFYSYLDTADWGALARYLEECIYRKKSRRLNFFKTLLNTYIVTSDLEAIAKLEKHCSRHVPKILERFTLQFSIPYLLGNKPDLAESFFTDLISRPGIRDRDWMRWNLAFSLLQLGKAGPAKEELVSLLEGKHEFVLVLLTLYMLDPYVVRDNDVKEKVTAVLAEYREKISRNRWDALFENAKKNIEVLILSQIITEAASWFFQDQKEGAPPR